MKNLFVFSAVLSMCILSSCGLFDDKDTDNANTLGGDTSIPMNQVGNKFKPGTVSVGGTTIPVTASMTITKNEGGIVTTQVTVDTANISQSTILKQLYDLVPSNMKDAAGRINTQLKFKITSEGVLDYVNMDEKPHTLIKYADGVGAKYSITKTSGKTLSRSITAKSSVDDFPYGFYNIKTTTIEQSMSIPGINKFVYRANHRFGIVHVKAVMEDGDSLKTYLFSDSTNIY